MNTTPRPPAPRPRSSRTPHIAQEVVPDFFGDEYYEKVSNALEQVDGMALSDHLAGRVVNVLFRKVFADELEPRSHDMVDDVRAYMQSILQKLFEKACKTYPVLLDEIKTNLVEEFMDSKLKEAAEAVSNVTKAELGWVFTQNRAYMATISNVRDTISKARSGERFCEADAGYSRENAIEAVTAVGDVPKEFIKKMINNKVAKDEEIRKLQVGGVK